MTSVDKAKFEEEVVSAALQIQLEEELSGARHAIAPGDQSQVEMQTASRKAELHKAEERVKRPEILSRICPVLQGVSDDIRDIASKAIPVLLPLAAMPSPIIPLTPIAFGALIAVVARAGVAALCGTPRPSDG